MHQRFADWCAEQIQRGLELGLDLESIEVKSDADFNETTSCRMADWVVISMGDENINFVTSQSF